MAIHPTAVIDKSVELDPTVEVGPYCIIEPGVTIAGGTRLVAHAYVATGTRIGRGVQLHPFSVVGHLPQDLAFKGEPTYCEIGDETIVREHAQIHRGTAPGSTTIVGKRCYLMATSHVGHNCILGDDVKMANCALLSGHVQVGSGAFISGISGAHQFVRIGERAMIGGGLRVPSDVPPFMIFGTRGVMGTNVVGLRRAGFTPAERQEIRDSYKLLFRSGLLFRDAVQRLAEIVKTDPGRRLLAFVSAPSKRGFAAYRGRARGAIDADS